MGADERPSAAAKKRGEIGHHGAIFSGLRIYFIVKNVVNNLISFEKNLQREKKKSS